MSRIVISLGTAVAIAVAVVSLSHDRDLGTRHVAFRTNDPRYHIYLEHLKKSSKAVAGGRPVWHEVNTLDAFLRSLDYEPPLGEWEKAHLLLKSKLAMLVIIAVGRIMQDDPADLRRDAYIRLDAEYHREAGRELPWFVPSYFQLGPGS
jgi:hypothetical protein